MDVSSCLCNLVNEFITYNPICKGLIGGFFVHKDDLGDNILKDYSYVTILIEKGYIDMYKYMYDERYHQVDCFIAIAMGRTDFTDWLSSIKVNSAGSIGYTLLKNKDKSFWKYLDSVIPNNALAICYSIGDLWTAEYFLNHGVTDLTNSLFITCVLNKIEMLAPIKEACLQYGLKYECDRTYIHALENNNILFANELKRLFEF